MRAATTGVATGVDLSSSGNDGDDDPGEPQYPPAQWHDGAAMMNSAVDLSAAALSHDNISISSSSGGFFVAEDVALLQDLLLDLPTSQDPRSSSGVASNALFSDASGLIGELQTLGAVVKSEPSFPAAEAVAAVGATAISSSPSSVDAENSLLAALKNEQPASEQLHMQPVIGGKSTTKKQSKHSKASAAGKKNSGDDSSSSNSSNSVENQAASQWLKWDDPNQVLDCAELPNASALEVRRIKNRDSMRRSRQRQRDELDRMKETVAQLEGQYEELCMRTTSSSSTLLDAQGDSSNSQQDTRITTREYSYREAVDVAKRLGAENLFLKASIQDQASWKLQLHRVLESMSFDAEEHHQSTPMDVDSSGDATLEREEMRAIYGFSPLSDEAVKDVILDSTRQVQDVQNELLGKQFVKSPRDRLTVFGWDIRRRMEGNEMEFAFVKRFPNASAYQIMKKTWDADLKLDRFKKIKSETRRLDILQQANANTYVLGRDVRFPDDSVVFRTVYLRFRMETSSELPSSPSGGVSHPLCKNGYVIGTQSINPANERPLLPSIGERERLVWADMTLWMEFFNVTDSASGASCCEVRWTGKTNYKSEAQAYRSAADTLLGLLRWEALAIAPVLTIC